ncbi:hypothetical protein QA783_14970, partial [Listeria monocytogenes]|nr:hypothetical protein [Listeria monocytogenes]
GYVFQDARLFPHYSVRGNLRYGMAKSMADAALIRREVNLILHVIQDAVIQDNTARLRAGQAADGINQRRFSRPRHAKDSGDTAG